MSRPIAVCTGMIATYAVGGVVWDYGQYLLGLERLGFDVYYLEDTGWEAYDPTVGLYGPDYTFGAQFLSSALASLSPTLIDRWHLRGMDGTIYGMSAEDIVDVIAEADIFLNVSGAALLREEYRSCRCTVLVDTDPGWNHFVNYPRWDAGLGWDLKLGLKGLGGWRDHDRFLTYAERIGEADCTIPSLGVEWRATRPPVVLDAWVGGEPGTTWTTVMTWNNFGKAIVHNGIEYGTKEVEFERVESLPSQVSVPLEMAVGGVEPPIARMRDLGWLVVAASEVSMDATSYQRYIQGSRGEFSVAKNIYVATHTGWFSCRSVCYLAAGLPVVVQDTGFSEIIPVGDGILPFTNLETARAGLTAAEATYAHHCKAAGQVAEQVFAADVVLTKLLNDCGVA